MFSACKARQLTNMVWAAEPRWSDWRLVDLTYFILFHRILFFLYLRNNSCCYNLRRQQQQQKVRKVLQNIWGKSRSKGKLQQVFFKSRGKDSMEESNKHEKYKWARLSYIIFFILGSLSLLSCLLALYVFFIAVASSIFRWKELATFLLFLFALKLPLTAVLSSTKKEWEGRK